MPVEDCRETCVTYEHGLLIFDESLCSCGQFLLPLIGGKILNWDGVTVSKTVRLQTDGRELTGEGKSFQALYHESDKENE